jgi:hypothetical protein
VRERITKRLENRGHYYLWNHNVRVQTLALPLTGCVTLGKSLNLSVPLPYQSVGLTLPDSSVRQFELIHGKPSQSLPGVSGACMSGLHPGMTGSQQACSLSLPSFLGPHLCSGLFVFLTISQGRPMPLPERPCPPQWGPQGQEPSGPGTGPLPSFAHWLWQREGHR